MLLFWKCRAVRVVVVGRVTGEFLYFGCDLGRSQGTQTGREGTWNGIGKIDLVEKDILLVCAGLGFIGVVLTSIRDHAIFIFLIHAVLEDVLNLLIVQFLSCN